jgi:hypothetical protein
MKAPIEGVIEAPAPPAPESKPNTELDERYTQLARREKAIRTEALRLKQQKEELEGKLKQAPSPDAWKTRLKSDLMGALAEAGMSYEEASQALLNTQPESHTVAQLKAEIAALKGEVTQKLSKYDEHTQKSYDRALGQYKRDIAIAVEAQQDDFEMIHTVSQTK